MFSRWTLSFVIYQDITVDLAVQKTCSWFSSDSKWATFGKLSDWVWLQICVCIQGKYYCDTLATHIWRLGQNCWNSARWYWYEGYNSVFWHTSLTDQSSNNNLYLLLLPLLQQLDGHIKVFLNLLSRLCLCSRGLAKHHHVSPNTEQQFKVHIQTSTDQMTGGVPPPLLSRILWEMTCLDFG